MILQIVGWSLILLGWLFYGISALFSRSSKKIAQTADDIVSNVLAIYYYDRAIEKVNFAIGFGVTAIICFVSAVGCMIASIIK